MMDEESQQASIPNYGTTVPASADAGGSARRVVVIALAAIALFASGVAVGSSIATTPRGASAYGGQLDELVGRGPGWCNYYGSPMPCSCECTTTVCV